MERRLRARDLQAPGADALTTAAPDPKPLHREGYSRPETPLERLGYAATRWFRNLGLVALALVALWGVVVGVPSLAVRWSDSWEAARLFVATDESVQDRLGGFALPEALPRVYRLTRERADFEFSLAGPAGQGEATVLVERPGGNGLWRVTSATFAVRARDAGSRGEIVARWTLPVERRRR